MKPSIPGFLSSRILYLLLFLLALPVLSARAAELPDFTKLVEQNSPAVVNISTTQKI